MHCSPYDAKKKVQNRIKLRKNLNIANLFRGIGNINLNTYIFDNFFNKLTQYALTDKHIDRFKIKYKKQFSSDENIVLKAILYDKVYQLDNS